MLVSTIIPCFNEEMVIRETLRQLTANLSRDHSLEYEFIDVNDGSVDGTQAILRDLAAGDGRAKIISFSHNVAHQPAVSTGLRHCKGQLAAIVDA